MPDNYTLVPYRGKLAADAPRYKAIGNSMAVPCVAWLGRKAQQPSVMSHEPFSLFSPVLTGKAIFVSGCVIRSTLSNDTNVVLGHRERS